MIAVVDSFLRVMILLLKTWFNLQYQDDFLLGVWAVVTINLPLFVTGLLRATYSFYMNAYLPLLAIADFQKGATQNFSGKFCIVFSVTMGARPLERGFYGRYSPNHPSSMPLVCRVFSNWYT